MAYTVTILGTPITLPDTSASPNWAPGQVIFNQAVANALQFTVGTFDIAPTTYQMVANSNTNVVIGGLAFPTSEIRGVFLYYTVFRQTTTNNESETGLMVLNYNPNNPTGMQWEVGTGPYVGNDTVTFAVTDSGQVTFSSAILPGVNHTGTIGYYAKVIQQVY